MRRRPGKTARLTEEQRALVERNVRIAYLAAHKLAAPLAVVGVEQEDAASIGFVGMCKAASQYNPAKAKESSYFFTAAKYEILHTIYMGTMQKRWGVESVSFDAELTEGEPDTGWDVAHLGPDDPVVDALVAKDLYRDMLDLLPDVTKQVMTMALEGYRGIEIGRVMGFSATTAYNHMKRARAVVSELREAAQ